MDLQKFTHKGTLSTTDPRLLGNVFIIIIPCFCRILAIMQLKKSHFKGIQLYSCQVVTLCSALNAISQDKHIILLHYTFRNVCALPSKLFLCISLVLYFHGTLLGYFLSDYHMVPIVPVTFVVYIPNSYYYYYLLLSCYFYCCCLCHRSFPPGTSSETAVIPTAQASSFTLRYFPCYV